MNPNPVPELETKRLAGLLANTLARADHLANDELGQTLRSAIGTFMVLGEICSKVLAIHGEQIGALSQTLLMSTWHPRLQESFKQSILGA